jgi:hypothetical protein
LTISGATTLENIDDMGYFNEIIKTTSDRNSALLDLLLDIPVILKPCLQFQESELY